MATIFTRIIMGDIPGTFVWRDDLCVAFMSINPLARGHVLVVPIEEVDQWVDTSPALAAHLFAVAHKIAIAQRVAFSPERVGMIIAGYEVPHAHIHLIPSNNMSELSFANAQDQVDSGELSKAADEIRACLRSSGPVEVVGP